MTPRPTMKPIPSPTTSVPSALPSLTGLIAAFQITGVVTSSLSDDEIAAIETQVVEAFNAEDDDIITSGILTIRFLC